VIYAWVPFNNFIGFVRVLALMLMVVLLLLLLEYCSYAALPAHEQLSVRMSGHSLMLT